METDREKIRLIVDGIIRDLLLWEKTPSCYFKDEMYEEFPITAQRVPGGLLVYHTQVFRGGSTNPASSDYLEIKGGSSSSCFVPLPSNYFND